jgi:hypothetical protein
MASDDDTASISATRIVERMIFTPASTIRAPNGLAGSTSRTRPNASYVPAVAAGHDTVYSYRCHNGRRKIARKLWAELPDRRTP